MTFKLKNILFTIFIVVITSISSFIYYQYSITKDKLFTSYQTKYHIEAIQIRDNYMQLLQRYQYKLKENETTMLQKLKELRELYQKSQNNFDIHKVAKILNRNVNDGKIFVSLINNEYIIEDSTIKHDIGLNFSDVYEIKELMQKVFDGTIALDISSLKVDTVSNEIAQYYLVLSPDKKYLLQLAYMYDISIPALELSNNLKLFTNADINVYLADANFVSQINITSKITKKPPFKESWLSSQKILQDFNTLLQNIEIEKLINSDIRVNELSISDVLTNIFSSHDKTLQVIGNEVFIFYSLSDFIYKGNDQLRLFIKTQHSMDPFYEEQLEYYRLFLLTTVVIFLIATIVYLGVVFNTRSIIQLSKDIKNNIPAKNTILISELNEVQKSYNKLHEELNEQIKMNKELTLVDPLTHIPNRRAFQQKLNTLIEDFQRYQTPFCIVLLDIDNFKNINDTYGHDTGDKVLVEFSSIVQSHIRKVDAFFRIGGEEFVIILPQLKLEQSFYVIEKVQKVIAEELMVIDGHKVTFSAGLTEVTTTDTDTTIYNRVDSLMYQSKENGKNKISCSYD